MKVPPAGSGHPAGRDGVVPRAARGALDRADRLACGSGTHLPATAARRGRFDLAAVPLAACTLNAETGVFEAFARTTTAAISLPLLGARELLSVQASAGLQVYDARAEAHAWPFLTAARYVATQDKAHEALVGAQLPADGLICDQARSIRFS